MAEARERGGGAASRVVSGLLLVPVVASAAFVVVYWRGGDTQLVGLAWSVSFAALGVALVVWAKRLLPDGTAVEGWQPPTDEHDAEAAAAETIDRDRVLERRPLLRGLLLGAGGAMGLAALAPLRSLGPRPSGALRSTPWAPGLRLVDEAGRVVSAGEVPVDGMVVTYPEGFVGAADAQTVLLHLGSGDATGVLADAPDGFVAFSRVCTHAGCPVAMFDTEARALVCPCHQSVFDVRQGAKPVQGPAARSLPRLPLALTDDGELVALGDFPRPVGPAWWTRP